MIAECAPLIIGGNDKTVLQPKKNYPMIKKRQSSKMLQINKKGKNLSPQQ